MERRSPAVGDVVEIYALGRWCAATVDTLYGAQAFGWTLTGVAGGVVQGGGAIDVSNAAWRWPRSTKLRDSDTSE